MVPLDLISSYRGGLSRGGKLLETVNLKADMPTVDTARRRLAEIIKNCRNRGVSAVKVIHGYGSQGIGGAIRIAVRKSLAKRVRTGEIKLCIWGENWSVLDQQSQTALARCDALSGDMDLGMGNPGITLIVF